MTQATHQKIQIAPIQFAKENWNFTAEPKLESWITYALRKSEDHRVTIHNKSNELLENGYCSIKSGRVIGGEMIPMENNIIILERFSHNPFKSVKSLSAKIGQGKPLNLIKYPFDGFLLGGEIDNIGHFILNCLPRLMMWQESYRKNGVRLIISEKLSQNIKDIIYLFAEDCQILALQENEIGEFSTLIAPLMLQSVDVHSGRISFCPQFNSFLEEKLNSLNISLDNPLNSDRIYISRSDASKRRILNEQYVIEFLSRHGFTSVIAGNLTVQDQIQIARSSSFFVTGFGNQSNLATFSRPAAFVFNFNPLENWRIMNALAFFSHGRYNYFDVQVSNGVEMDDDYEIPLSALEAILPHLT